MTTKGLDPANFKMGLMTFESQKYICVKEGAVSHVLDLGIPPFFGATHWADFVQTLQKVDLSLIIHLILFVYSKSPSSTLAPVSMLSAAI